MVRALLDLLLGRGRRLYPFEFATIEAVAAQLSEASGGLLRKQVSVINEVQRMPWGKEVNLYQARGGVSAFDNSLRFPDRRTEAILATVWLTHPCGGRAQLKVELWLVDGRLFQLMFNKKPKEFFAGIGLHKVRAVIVDVKIWCDPMQAPELDEVETAARKNVDATLPAGYEEMISETTSAGPDGYVLHGLSDVRKVALSDANYYILAEFGTANALAVKEGDRDGEIYALDYEDETQLPMGKSFKEAVSKMTDLQR